MTPHHAGLRHLTALSAGRALPLMALYPTDTPAQPQPFGPYTMAVAVNAPVCAGRHPVVLISHGNNGSPLTHRDTATHLARHGFVVLLPEHVGNSRSRRTAPGRTGIRTSICSSPTAAFGPTGRSSRGPSTTPPG